MEERDGERGLQIFLENSGDFQIFHHVKGGIMFGLQPILDLEIPDVEKLKWEPPEDYNQTWKPCLQQIASSYNDNGPFLYKR